MAITLLNNGSITEILANTLIKLQNANHHNYLSNEIAADSRNDLRLEVANKRGFSMVLDYTTNANFGFMAPNTSTGAKANLIATAPTTLDRITANYQYIQFGHEIANEELVNSQQGLHKGPGARELELRKMLERRMEVEEWYLCRGNGFQDLATISANSAAAIITCDGTLDGGAGAYMLRVNQVIRIYDATRTTLKGTRTITAKSSNKSFTVDSNITVVAGDVILPVSDTTVPTVVGLKGMNYMVKNQGDYFSLNMTNTPSLQATIDSTTTTLGRNALELLYRKHTSYRNNGSANTKVCTSPSQMSNYYIQFYAEFAPEIHHVGNERGQIDVGGRSHSNYTYWGQPISEYKYYDSRRWDNIDLKSFYRITPKEAGRMLTLPQDYVLKVSGSEYVNVQQTWHDSYLEFFSPNPPRNSGFTALAFNGLPVLADDAFTGS